MANLLTDLAAYSRQQLQVGTPPHSIYTRDGSKPSHDIIQLSLLARIANALEGNEGTLTARLRINVHQADDFRDLVEDLDGRPEPLAITGWRLVADSQLDDTRLEVSLSYEDGQMLYVLGRYWESFTLGQLTQEGGQRNG